MLSLDNISKAFDGVKAVQALSCSIEEREIVGLIGPNGAGKTTLFNVISGFLSIDSGRILYKGEDLSRIPPYRISNLGIGRTFQNLRLVRQISVLDNVLLSFRSQPGEKLRNIFFNWRKSREHELQNRGAAISLLKETDLARKAEEPAEELSYGQQKLLSLVCCLAARSDLLLLDEPVSGIAPEMIDKIIKIISRLPSSGKSVVLIEHNLDAVMQVCDRVIFMDAGRKVCEGTPEEVRNDPRVIEAYVD